MARNVWGSVLTAAEGLGGAGAAVGLLGYWLRRREVREAGTMQVAKVAQTLTDTAMELLEPVRTHAAEAEAKAAVLQKQFAEAEAAIKALTEALASEQARSRAEREELQRQLDEVRGERDRLAAELARRDAELNGAHRVAPGAVQEAS